MTTTIARPATPAGPEARGRTTVAERAVERVAARVLTEVDDVGGSARRMLGIAVGDADPDGEATVSARVEEEAVALEVRLSVTYPASVRRTTEAARDRLRARVEALTGLWVSRVDIVVTELPGAAVDSRRVR